jgi:hypothetical protein
MTDESSQVASAQRRASTALTRQQPLGTAPVPVTLGRGRGPGIPETLRLCHALRPRRVSGLGQDVDAR